MFEVFNPGDLDSSLHLAIEGHCLTLDQPHTFNQICLTVLLWGKF